MKKITKDFKNPPAVLVNQTTKGTIALALTEKNKHKFKTSIYRHKTVLEELSSAKMYNNKCAFCESDTTAGAPLQVEHYRPKAKVTGEDQPLGYYWLGYEWTNLLLACSTCNNKKRNHFPIDITGNRVLTHPILNGNVDENQFKVNSTSLLGEVALIINPEIETETRSNFTFLHSGEINGNNEKAKKTIKHCGLDRPILTITRKKFYDKLFNKFMKHFDKHNKNEVNDDQLFVLLVDTIEDLIAHLADNGVYYEFAYTCWKQFQKFFINRFQPPEQAHLKKAYDKVLLEVKNT